MQEILAGLDATELSLSQTIQRIVRDLRRRLSYIESRTNTRFLHQMIAQYRQTLDYAHDRMSATIERSLKQYSALLSAKEQQLSALAPLAPLQRGFALIERNGTMLTAKDTLAPDDTITIRRAFETSTAHIHFVTSQPDTSQPDTSQPDTSQPDTSQPDTSHTDSTF
jgi:exodeoxyribonuclease VII large subunit